MPINPETEKLHASPDLDYHRLSERDNLWVSSLGFGSAQIGHCWEFLDEDVARSAVEQAIKLGINYFDTSPLYGYGESESRLGTFIGEKVQSGDLVLSTKLGWKIVPWDGRSERNRALAHLQVPLTAELDFSEEGMRRQLEDSCKRLGVTKLPVALLHDPDGGSSWGNWQPATWDSAHIRSAFTTGLSTLCELRSEGKIGLIGIGINQVQAIEKMFEFGIPDVVLPATRINLLDHTDGIRLNELCQKHNVGIVAASPFVASPLLRIGTAAGRRTHFGIAPMSDQFWQRLTRIEEIAQGFDIPLAALSVQLPKRLSMVKTVLVGLANPEQVQQNHAWATKQIPSELWGAMAKEGLIHESLGDI